MSAAHTVLENGGRVLVLDKSAFCGGNSTKATSGINAAGSRTQRVLNIPDTPEIFEADTLFSASDGARPDLVRALTHQSGPAVDWLMDAFGLDLSVIARLAAHTHPRTHRGTERFPGMMITYGLMEKLDEVAAQGDGKARVVTKATVTDLIKDGDEIIGVKYTKGGKTMEEYGVVVLATGGFGADFTDGSLLKSVQPDWNKMKAWGPDGRAGIQAKGVNCAPMDLMGLPTTNGPHCTGDGIKLAVAAGSGTFDMEAVQVHPTGLVDPSEPDAKVKFLAAEALRGSGGIILDREGNRFCDELGKRDYVTGRMWFHDKAPYRLVLNKKSTDLISWHCEHYCGRGLMKELSGAQLAKEMGVSTSKFDATFAEYDRAAAKPDGPDNKWEKKYFHSLPYKSNDTFMVAQITPVVHYCMGGVAGSDRAEIIRTDGTPIPGLFAAGEVLGGIHGTNRLGGSSLLDCVVFGRIAGESSSKYLMEKLIKSGGAGSLAAGGALPGNITASVNVVPGSNKVTLDVAWGEDNSASASAGAQAVVTGDEDGADFTEDPNAAFYGQGFDAKKKDAGGDKQTYTPEEVAKHTTDKDCWVILHGEVYNVTDFLDDHPGGKKAIMLYAGKDASTEFDMMHSADIITRYATEYHVGSVAPGSAKL